MKNKCWRKEETVGDKIRYKHKNKRFEIQITPEPMRGCPTLQPNRIDLIDKEYKTSKIGYDHEKKCARNKKEALRIAEKMMEEHNFC